MFKHPVYTDFKRFQSAYLIMKYGHDWYQKLHPNDLELPTEETWEEYKSDKSLMKKVIQADNDEYYRVTGGPHIFPPL